MSEKTGAIGLSSVWVGYNGAPVLEDITFSIEEREIISIVGPNGSGKTTLLRCIMGFMKPDRGAITVFGKSPDQVRDSGVFGYLPQGGRHDRSFPVSAFDVVAMARYSRKGLFERLSDADRRAIMDSLRRVEMDPFVDRPFGMLSGGQQQRVLIARALAGRPRILMLDEPSTGLDAVAQDNFYQLLRELRDSEALTIVMVSHDIGAVSSVVDRVACIKTRIHFHGAPHECDPEGALAKTFGKNIYVINHDKNCATCGKHK